jgi:apolipoprotein N-acyltransferase
MSLLMGWLGLTFVIGLSTGGFAPSTKDKSERWVTAGMISLGIMIVGLLIYGYNP